MMKKLFFLLTIFLMLSSCVKDMTEAAPPPLSVGGGTKTKPIEIGDTLYGGIIGYIFQENDIGYVEGETHGLVLAKKYMGSRKWGCMGVEVGAKLFEVGTGIYNTNLIVSKCATVNNYSAADICNEYVVDNYDDWYLPNIKELLFLCNHIPTIVFPPNSTVTSLWTSTEIDKNSAYSFNSFGYYNNTNKDINIKVHPVRTF